MNFQIDKIELPEDLKELHEHSATLRQEFLDRFVKAQITAQNKLAQEVLDNGEALEGYRFYETNWFEDTVWHYKNVGRRRNETKISRIPPKFLGINHNKD